MDPSPSIDLEELLANASWARGLARALIADPNVAEDLVQQAWLAALRSPPSAKASLRPWLASVIRNLASDHRRADERRAQRELAAARAEALPASDEIAQAFELHRSLVDAISELDEPLREIVLRHYFHGLSSVEIARREGLPESTVRTRLQRALESLRTKLDRKYGDRSTWSILCVPLIRHGFPPSGHALPTAHAPSNADAAPNAHAPSGIPPSASTLGWTALITMSTLGKAAVVLALVGAAALLMRQGMNPSTPTPHEFVAAPPVQRLASPADEAQARGSEVTDARVSAVPPSSGQTENPTVANVEAPAVLEARAIDASAAPIEGAELVVVDRADLGEIERSSAPRAESGPNGKMSLEVHPNDRSSHRGSTLRPKGTWTIQVAVVAPAHTKYTIEPEVTAGGTIDLGDVVLGPGGSIQGRVATVDSSQLPKTWISLITPDLTFEELARGGAPYRSSPIATAPLAADGSYEFDGAPVGTYRINATVAHEEGWIGAVSEPISVRAGEITSVPDLVLRPNSAAIHGLVVDSTGAPASNMDVAYHKSGSEGPGTSPWVGINTGKDGRFVINIARGMWDIAVKGNDEKTGACLVRNVPSGTTDLVVHAPVATWIQLLVKDEHGIPVPEFTASTTGGDSRTGGHPQGRTRIPVFPWQSHLRVSAQGREQVELGPFDLEHHPDSLDVTLRSIPTIRGRVLAEGKPVQGAHVSLISPKETSASIICNGFPFRFDPERFLDSSVETDAEGTFAMTERQAGRVMVVARAQGYADARSAELDHDAGASQPDIEIHMTRGGELVGRVLPAPGASIAGTLVGIARDDGLARMVRVGADGAYRFEALAPGRWAIRRCEHDFVSQSSYTWNEVQGLDPSLQFFDIEEGRTTSFDLDLRDARCTLEGRLQWSHPTQRIWTAKLMPLPDVESGEVSGAVSPDGTFRLEASRLGPSRLVLADTGDGGLEQRIEATIDLVRGSNAWSLALATGSIEGEAAPGSMLTHIWTNASGDSCTTRFLADAHGRFRVDGVPSGSGRVLVAPSKDRDASVSVDVPENGLVHLTLP